MKTYVCACGNTCDYTKRIARSGVPICARCRRLESYHHHHYSKDWDERWRTKRNHPDAKYTERVYRVSI